MTNDRHDDDTNPDNLPPVNQQRDCPSCRRHPSACNASARRRRLLLSPSARFVGLRGGRRLRCHVAIRREPARNRSADFARNRLARASSRSTAVLCSSFSLRSSASRYDNYYRYSMRRRPRLRRLEHPLPTAETCSTNSDRSTSPSSSSASTSSPTSTSASASPAVATPPKSTPSVKPSPSPSSPTTRSSSTSTPRTCSSRPSSSSTAPCWSPTTVAASPRSSVVAARVLASRSPTDKGVRQASGGALRWRGGWGRYDKVQCVLRRFMVGIGKKGSESTYLLARGWVTHWHLRSLAFGGL